MVQQYSQPNYYINNILDIFITLYYITILQYVHVLLREA